MNISGYKSALYFLGTAALTLGFTGMAVRAETSSTADLATQTAVVSTDTIRFNKEAEAELQTIGSVQPTSAMAQLVPLSAEPTYATEASVLSQITLLEGAIAQAPNTTDGNSIPSGSAPGVSQTTPDTTTPATPGTTTPVAPEPTTPTVPDSTTPFTPDTAPPTTPDTTPAPDTTPPPTDPVAPSLVITPGRATRSGPSYIGIGGNIGLGTGDTALGEGSFAIFSKIGLTRNLSVRPAVLFSDNASILIPVTFDFIPLVTRATETTTEAVGFRASPYIGPGIIISTGNNSTVDFLLTGGVDIPVTERLSVTAQINASFFDNVAVGLLLGVGFNF